MSYSRQSAGPLPGCQADWHKHYSDWNPIRWTGHFLAARLTDTNITLTGTRFAGRTPMTSQSTGLILPETVTVTRPWLRKYVSVKTWLCACVCVCVWHSGLSVMLICGYCLKNIVGYGQVKEGSVLFTVIWPQTWLRTILIVRKETRCRHIGYSYRLTARVLLYAPSHRQDSTYHGLCYTSRGVLAGMRNSSMGPPWRIDPMTHHTTSERSYHRVTSHSGR